MTHKNRNAAPFGELRISMPLGAFAKVCHKCKGRAAIVNWPGNDWRVCPQCCGSGVMVAWKRVELKMLAWR